MGDEPEPEPEIEEKWFQCHNCKLKQKYDVKGKASPSVKHITLKEDSYIMADPFVGGDAKNVLILGSDCAVCKNPICQSPDCSIYFRKRYCQKCASANKNIFPEQLQQKIKNSV